MTPSQGPRHTFGGFLRLLREERSLSRDQVEICSGRVQEGEPILTADWLAALERDEAPFDPVRCLPLCHLYRIDLQALVEAYQLRTLTFLMPDAGDQEAVLNEGHHHLHQGRREEAYAWFWKAEFLADTVEGRLAARLAKSAATGELQKYSLSLACCQQVLRAAPAPSRLRSMAHYNQALVHFALGDLEAARFQAERGLAVTPPTGHRSRLFLHEILAATHLFAHDYGQPLQSSALDAALRHFGRELFHSRNLAPGQQAPGAAAGDAPPAKINPCSPMPIAGIGLCLAWKGDYPRGRALLDRSLTMLRRDDDVHFFSINQAHLRASILRYAGRIALEAGELATARERFTEAQAEADAYGFTDFRFFSHFWLARLVEAEEAQGVLTASEAARRRRRHWTELATLYPSMWERAYEVREYERTLRPRAEALLQDRARQNLATSASHGILFQSDVMRKLLQEAGLLALADLPVLLVGESGTGKELIARFLHAHSARARGPFISVHCGALSDSLLEAELFGSAKGAFTGAETDKMGLLEAAHTGTLFLDEIGGTSARLQVTLLRALEERAVRRLGETQHRPLDVRVVSATNQPLDHALRQGRCRLDFFHRIAGATLTLPPLRERREDVPLLLTHHLQAAAAALRVASPTLTREARAQLVAAPWPGNVRELRNLCEQLCIQAPGKPVDREDLPATAIASHRPSPRAQKLYTAVIAGTASFWDDVASPFLRRELNRREVQSVIAYGLQAAQGRYKNLVRLFRLPESDYQRLIKFLHKHDCRVDYRQYRRRAATRS